MPGTELMGGREPLCLIYWITETLLGYFSVRNDQDARASMVGPLKHVGANPGFAALWVLTYGSGRSRYRPYALTLSSAWLRVGA
jgi:hypothetical protein